MTLCRYVSEVSPRCLRARRKVKYYKKASFSAKLSGRSVTRATILSPERLGLLTVTMYTQREWSYLLSLILAGTKIIFFFGYAKRYEGRRIVEACNWMVCIGCPAQTHFIFLSWYKKTKQKKIKADVPSRPAMCLFTKRRKLAFGSNSSTFLTLISHSGYPISPHRPICFVLRTKLECRGEEN